MRLIVLLMLAALSWFPLARADEAVELPFVKVGENRFGSWGMGIETLQSLASRITGGSFERVTVCEVLPGSQAYLAGIETGNEIDKINGRDVTKIPAKELKALFFDSSSGDEIRFELLDPFRKRINEVKLKLSPTVLPDGALPVLFWNATVIADWSKSDLNFNRLSRTLELKWANKKIGLTRRTNGSVEMIDGDTKHVLKPGAIITLKPDGHCELSEPQRPQTGKTPVRYAQPPSSQGILIGASNILVRASDTKWSYYGQYLQNMVQAVQVRWDILNTVGQNYPAKGTIVGVTVTIDSAGDISAIDTVDSKVIDVRPNWCVSAISPGVGFSYGAWTDEMVASLGASQKLTFAFLYR
jgi:hypothetical protein